MKALREQLGIPKSAPPREYTSVAELPPGKQMQVDFGEMYMPNARGTGKTKVRFAVFVLSHSRYKFAYFQSRPFHTIDLITAMTECFRYFDGMPDEIVFDQDSIVCISENSGDIICENQISDERRMLIIPITNKSVKKICTKTIYVSFCLIFYSLFNWFLV